MLEHVDTLLWEWGDWARGHSVTGQRRITMNYQPRGVMATNPDYDNPRAESLDRLIAGLPDYMRDSRKAINRKYLFAWRVDDAARDMRMSRDKFEKLIDRAHHFLAAKLQDDEKIC